MYCEQCKAKLIRVEQKVIEGDLFICPKSKEGELHSVLIISKAELVLKK